MGRTIATIEARTASSRLPFKVLAEIAGKPMLALVIERVAHARSVDQIVLATTTAPEDDELEAMSARLGVACYRGSVDDVMGRVLEAATRFDATDVLAFTGDNPLVDSELIDDVVTFYRSGGYDYATTTHMHHSRNWDAVRTFPVGVSVQIFSQRTFVDAASRTSDPVEREHVSFAIYDHPERYRLGAFEAAGSYAGWRHPELRLTVDTPEDLALMRKIFGTLYPANCRFSTAEAIRLVAGDTRLATLNRHVTQKLVYREKQQVHG